MFRVNPNPQLLPKAEYSYSVVEQCLEDPATNSDVSALDRLLPS